MAARTCDSCKGSPALLFCSSDSAFLCGACDAKVHGANKFASRHGRVWVCEVCEQAPAAVTCKADAAALCFSCDSDIHSANPLACRHERLPLAPFYESPAPVTAALKSSRRPDINLLVKPPDDEDDDNIDGGNYAGAGSIDLQRKPAAETPELEVVDYFLSDVDPYTEVDYASSMDAMYDHADHIVPVRARTVTAAAHGSPAFVAQEGFIDLDLGGPKAPYGSCYTAAPSLSHSMSSTDVGVVPEASATTVEVSNLQYGGLGAAVVLLGREREARLMRYREKRKNRKFEKTIRYASRKAYAETRPRVKGRFAKRTGMEGAPAMHAAAGLVLDADFGVVPSF
ncbi:hypothetical protein Taro_041935 [Colocasia esculenta]|uniref:CONSTANS-like protein n=1 Tax=Colocasia esculenta TaxID=4460 RepID=A0A843WYJ5_COLES|nr:hypothetical protein [Colocasia esculenta]